MATTKRIIRQKCIGSVKCNIEIIIDINVTTMRNIYQVNVGF